MPELPEVETAARDLDVQIRGCRVVAVERLGWPRMVETPTPEAFVAGLTGRIFQSVGRRAKWIVATLDSDLTLAMHLRMSGVAMVVGPQALPDAHTHLVLRLDDDRQLHFRDVRKFGRLRLLDAPGLAALDASHGPEPLAAAFTPDALARVLSGRATRLKPLLLDPRAIAGLGNIYVDEALWHAQLGPDRRADGLSVAEITTLHGAIQSVLRRAIDLGGSTFRDYRNGYGQSGGNQVFFAAYRRAGEPCPRCGTAIARRVLAGRGTHICPACQGG